MTVWALRRAGVGNPICRCACAADIDALWTDSAISPTALSAKYPLLVLLDLNLPGMNWYETLHRLRTDRWWRSVPVVVISTSTQPATVAACYGLGVAGYLKKLLDPDLFAAAIRRLAAYWLETVVPPMPPGDFDMEPSAMRGG